MNLDEQRYDALTAPLCLNAASDTGEAQCDFARAVDDFAAVGLAGIPLGGIDGKTPLVKNYTSYTIRRARKDATRFPSANVGFMCGTTNGITVVDVDEEDRHALHWALRAFGDSPLVVLTGSGRYHIYYRNSGERRHVHPRDRPGYTIDILGHGSLCVAPPSIRPGGLQYEYVCGDLSDIPYLPPIQSGAVEEFLAAQGCFYPSRGFSDVRHTGEIVAQGNRTNVIFAHARVVAHTASTLQQVSGELLAINAKHCDPPLSDAEVFKQARGAWKLKLEGDLWLPGRQYLKLAVSQIEPLLRRGGERALVLYLKLRMAHGHWRKLFAISPEGMEKSSVIPGWGKGAYRSARKHLELMGLLTETHRGGNHKGDPSTFQFSTPTRH